MTETSTHAGTHAGARLDIAPLNPHVGAEVRGLDVTAPRDDAWRTLRAGLLRHGVLVLRDQALTKAQHIAVSRRFGALETYLMGENTDPEHPEIFLIGNAREAGGGTPYAGAVNRNWHSDSIFLDIPSDASLLYCRIAPRQGAVTLFASTVSAFANLPESLRERVIDRSARYSYADVHEAIRQSEMPDTAPLSAAEKATHPDVWHPLVRRHPETGQPALLITEDTVSEISGLGAAGTRALVTALCAHITREEAVYRHKWRAGDLVIWDNRSTMHAATPFDQTRKRRLMHRTTVKGSAPVEAWKPA